MIPFLHRLTGKTSKENPLWLIVLSDIMTNLMLFFLVMYVFTRQPDSLQLFTQGFEARSVQSDEKAKRADRVLQTFREKDAAEALTQQFENSALKDLANIRITDRQIRVQLAAPVLFKSGGAALSGDAMRTLDAVGKILTGLPNEIIVEGHTDNAPVSHSVYGTNWELSAARATSVIGYLSRKFSLPEQRFTAAAYGEFMPLDTNATAAGRARNRRIELVILRENV